jgi:hypothetical protein
MKNKVSGGVLGDQVERGLWRQGVVEALAKEAGAKCRESDGPPLFTLTWSSTDLPAFIVARKGHDAG